jgi:hypothetical protein
MNNTGILTIAGGDLMYGSLALNLCASIRVRDPEIGIAVAVDEANYTRFGDGFRKMKVQLIMLQDFQYMDGQKYNFFKAKTFIYQLSPFDNTLFLDSDMLWLNKKPADFVKALEDVEFTMLNEGKINVRTGEVHTTGHYTLWTEWENILEKYATRLGDFFYQCRSEVIWFKKSNRMKTFFKAVRKIYDNPKIDFLRIGGCLPDELAFNIASSTCEIYPHREKWCPAFWHFMYFKIHRTNLTEIEIISKFAIMSVGGNAIDENIRKMYNRRAEDQLKRLGVRGFSSLKDKRLVIAERKSI